MTRLKRIHRVLSAVVLAVALTMNPSVCHADFWGGDDVILAQILAQAVEQLSELRAILTTGADTLDLLQDMNRGIRDGLAMINVRNPKFAPGLFSDLGSTDQILSAVRDLYGRTPRTSEARVQDAQDQSVAESIAMNAALFDYANQVDDESKQMIDHAQVVNPEGAGKLTAQSVAVLIGVTTQMLRTNSMMLKLMAENMAIQNQKQKLASSQFKTQYDGISNALGALPTQTKLPELQPSGE